MEVVPSSFEIPQALINQVEELVANLNKRYGYYQHSVDIVVKEAIEQHLQRENQRLKLLAQIESYK